jgi:hypothetical protein
MRKFSSIGALHLLGGLGGAFRTKKPLFSITVICATFRHNANNNCKQPNSVPSRVKFWQRPIALGHEEKKREICSSNARNNSTSGKCGRGWISATSGKPPAKEAIASSPNVQIASCLLWYRRALLRWPDFSTQIKRAINHAHVTVGLWKIAQHAPI